MRRSDSLLRMYLAATVVACMLCACSQPNPAPQPGPDAAAVVPVFHHLGTDNPDNLRGFPVPSPTSAAGALVSDGGGGWYLGSPPISNLDASALSPGSAGQSLFTNAGATSAFWQTPTFDNVANHSGIDCSGATDSYTALQALLNADAGIACLSVPTGCHLKVGTPLNPPSYTCWMGNGSASILSTISGSGATNSLFYAKFTNLGTVASTTLEANAVKGSRTLVVNSATGFAAGQQIIAISSAAANTEQQFTVLSVNAGDGGAGSATITVDDPVVFTFVTNDAIETYNPPIGVYLDGRGMIAAGSGGALFEMASCWHCTVANWEVPNTSTYPVTVTSYIGTMDVSGRDNLWYRMHVNAGGTAVYGLAIESENRSKAVDCTATNATTAGFWEATGAYNEWRGDKAWNNTLNGLNLAVSSASDNDGVQHGRVDGCDFYGNGNAGIFLEGVTDEEISDSHLDYNAYDGLYAITGNSTYDTGIRLSNVTLNNEANGIYTGSGTHDISGTNVEANLDTTSALNLTASTSVVSMRNFRSTDCDLTGGHVVDVGAGVQLSLEGARIRKTQNNSGAWIGLITDGTGARINADDLTLELVGSPTGTTYGIFENATSTTILSRARTVGTLGTGLYSSGVAATIDVQQNVDFTSCSTPFNTDGSVVWTPTTLWGTGGNPVATFSGANGISVASSVFPVTDNTDDIGVASHRFAGMVCGPSGYEVLHAASAANPTAALGDGTLALGPGGNSAPTGSSTVLASLGPWSVAPSSDGVLFLGTGGAYAAASNGSDVLYVNGATSIAMQVGGTTYADLTSSAFSPNTVGEISNGTAALPWGPTFVGGATALNLGYTEFAAAGGTHDNQIGVDFRQAMQGQSTAYGAVNGSAINGTSGHGALLFSTAVMRIVTAGSGTCSGTIWTATAGTTYVCQAASYGWYNGSAWAGAVTPAYPYCVASGGGVSVGPGSPVATINSSNVGATATITWTPYNDGCTSQKPVIDMVISTEFLEN